MKEFINKYKREVIMSVVVSLITTGIIKVWDWLVLVAPVYGKTFIGTINNLTYAMAASQSSISLIRALITCLLGIAWGCAFITIEKYISAIRTSAKLEKLYRHIEKGSKDDVTEFLSEMGDNKPLEQKTAEAKKSQKKLFGLMIVFILHILLMYASVDVFILRPSMLWSKFEKDITMIAPYVDAYEIIQMKSKWVCMRGKLDYTEIYEYIDAVKEEYSLPEN